MRRRWGAALAACVVLAIAMPVTAQDPGLQPGFVESICPSRVPPDPDCATIAYPLVDVWAVAAILPIKQGDSAAAAYDALIPEPFTPPAVREIALLMFRLDIPASPSSSIETDPGDGYAEGSVAIRVGFPAADGFPYDAGWWDLAQPLNDQSQYGAGRGVGLPKYMAEASVRRAANGDWAARALDWGKAEGQSGGPGSVTVAGGNVLEIDWTPADPGVSDERAHQLWRWGQYGDPLFVQTAPYDEVSAHDPAMVKFSPTSLVPVYGVERTPLTEYPDPIIGTATVRLEGTIPGAHDTLAAGSFADLIDPGPHTVGGTLAFARGYAFLTTDNLSNNVG